MAAEKQPDLEAIVASLDSFVDDIEAMLAAEPLEDIELEGIEAVTSAPEAPADLKLLRSRVEAGAYTWHHIWNQSAEFGDTGMRLVSAVGGWMADQVPRWKAEADAALAQAQADAAARSRSASQTEATKKGRAPGH